MRTVRCTTGGGDRPLLDRPADDHRRRRPRPLFPGVFAIFGHGNVTCLGQALEQRGDALPTWRGQNEQGMALAAVAFAKAMRRRQIMVATSSIGPGATNMVTAAGVAHANRLPLLLLAGDTFASRIPDPVLQQVEHFGDPSVDGERRLPAGDALLGPHQRPEQVATRCPTPGDDARPGECGPAFLALPQDVQAEAFDFPGGSSSRPCTRSPGRGPTAASSAAADALRRARERPLIIAGGGVHYSFAEDELRRLRRAAQHPRRRDGRRQGQPASPPTRCNAGPIGVTGCTSANALAAEADVVLAVGTRLQDFTTGSWTVFRNEAVRFIGLNTAGFDAVKHLALPLVADAREGLAELSDRARRLAGADGWAERAATETAQYHRYIDKIASPTRRRTSGGRPTPR